MRAVQRGWIAGGRILTIALISSVTVIAAAERAEGATRTFVGADNSTWSNGSNWSPARPLAADDDLVFPAAGAATSINDRSSP
jgi:hypothetical protein